MRTDQFPEEPVHGICIPRFLNATRSQDHRFQRKRYQKSGQTEERKIFFCYNVQSLFIAVILAKRADMKKTAHAKRFDGLP
jgi:hypothetical protein